jgi:MFS transporter
MGQMVVNVTISRWFVRMRGRALALAGMGHGLAKVGMPLCAAALIVYAGWRGTWAVFGLLTLSLVVGPSLLFMRRRPEDMGLLPDGILSTKTKVAPTRSAIRERKAIVVQTTTSSGRGVKRCAPRPSGSSLRRLALRTSA